MTSKLRDSPSRLITYQLIKGIWDRVYQDRIFMSANIITFYLHQCNHNLKIWLKTQSRPSHNGIGRIDVFGDSYCKAACFAYCYDKISGIMVHLMVKLVKLMDLVKKNFLRSDSPTVNNFTIRFTKTNNFSSDYYQIPSDGIIVGFW